MALERERSGRRVPTLTEVISPPTTVDLLLDVPLGLTPSRTDPLGDLQAQPEAHGGADVTIPFTKSTIPSVSALLASAELDEVSVHDEANLIAQVLAVVQQQIDAGLDARLREVLAPVLARATETMISETREQFATTLQEMVALAVAQELARHRDR